MFWSIRNLIPGGLCQLSEVAKWGSGGTPKSGEVRYYGGDIPWAVIGDLTDSLVSETATTITKEGLENSSAKIVPAGAILIAMYGSIGKLGIAARPLATNQAIAFAISDESRILPRFLFLFLLSQRSQLLASGKGATQQNISQTLLKSWPIPLPPLDEQEKIVEILEEQLSRLDAATAAIAAVRTKADRFRRSLLRAAFAGQLVPHSNDCDSSTSWPKYPLKDLVQFGPKAPTGRFERGEAVSFIPMPKVAEVTGDVVVDEEITPTEGKRRNLTYFENGDVIFAKITPCMENGKIARPVNLLNGAAFGSTEFHVLRPSPRIDGEFLRLFLVQDDFRYEAERAMTGAVGQRRVPRKYLEEFEVVCPPVSLQEQIVQMVSSQLEWLDSVLKAATSAEARLQRLRRSLLQAAFCGNLTKEWREAQNG